MMIVINLCDNTPFYVTDKDRPYDNRVSDFRHALKFTLEEARKFKENHPLHHGVLFEYCEDIDGVPYLRPIGG